MVPTVAKVKGLSRGMMGADTSTFADGRIAFLKADLAITDAQKGAWEPYAAALKKNLQGMQAMRQVMVSVMEAKTPVERLDAHISVMDGRLASLKEVKPALAALYGALSDDQKKKADQILSGMGCRSRRSLSATPSSFVRATRFPSTA
jgi:hypothetical protein